MALIKCPHCGKEISDKAKKCIYCKKNIVGQFSEKKIYICKECGNEMEEKKKICPKCGCPVEKEKRKLPPTVRKMILILIVAFAIIAAACIILFFCLHDYFSYKEALNNYNQGNYVLAAEQFKVIGEYKDSSEQYKKSIYALAKELYEEGDISGALEKFESIPNYSDSADILKEIYYIQAHEFYDLEDYENAIPLFEKASGYKDADELLADSQYQISTDVQFLKALKIGLQNRWDLTNNETTVEVMGIQVNTSTVEDYQKYVQKELDQILIYEKKTFIDEELGEYAREYIEAIHIQERALAYANVDSDRYNNEWEKGYSQRCKVLRDLVSKYDFTVDDVYQSNLNELVLRGEVNKEHENLEQQIQKMINVDCTLSSVGRSSKTYEMLIENTTVVNFSSFKINIKLLNDEGVVVETVKTNTVKEFVSGQKVIFSFDAEREFSSIIPSADYTIA